MHRFETEKSHIVVLPVLPWQPIYQDKNLKFGLHTNLQCNLSKIIIWFVGEHLLLNEEIIQTMEVIAISLITFGLIKFLQSWDVVALNIKELLQGGAKKVLYEQR